MKVKWEMNKSFLSDLTDNVLLPAVEKQNEQAIINSVEYAPVRTGALAKSIEGKVEAEKSEIKSVIGSDKEYAIYQELGTSKFSGKYFFRRGVLSSIKTLEAEIKKNMEKK